MSFVQFSEQIYSLKKVKNLSESGAQAALFRLPAFAFKTVHSPAEQCCLVCTVSPSAALQSLTQNYCFSLTFAFSFPFASVIKISCPIFTFELSFIIFPASSVTMEYPLSKIDCGLAFSRTVLFCKI